MTGFKKSKNDLAHLGRRRGPLNKLTAPASGGPQVWPPLRGKATSGRDQDRILCLPKRLAHLVEGIRASKTYVGQISFIEAFELTS